MGGTDDSTNLVELTIDEHAEAHRNLYEQYGKIEDKIAYLGLLKQIGQEEILLEKSKLGGRRNKGIPKTAEHKIKISKNAAGGVTEHSVKTKRVISNKMKDNTNSSGHKTDDYKQKQSQAMKLAWQRRKANSV
jgi:hypothetical protein